MAALGAAAAAAPAAGAPSFVRGDVNFDGQVSLADVVQVFETVIFDGPPYPCEDAVDVADDGTIDDGGAGEALALWQWLFRDSPAPAAPFPLPGEDPTGNDNYFCEAAGIDPPGPPAPGYEFDWEAPRYVRRGSQGVPVYLRVRTQRAIGAFSLAFKVNKNLVSKIDADFAETVFPKVERQAFEGSPYFRVERVPLLNDNEFDLLLIAAIFVKSPKSLQGAGSSLERLLFAATERPLVGERLLRVFLSVSFSAPLGTATPALVPADSSLLVPGGPGVLHGLRNELSPINPDTISVSVAPAVVGPWEPIAYDAGEFLRADANGDRCRDLSDPLHTLNFLFLGGPRPLCPDAADANDSGGIDISDSVFTLTYLFSGGPPPPHPPLIGPEVCWFDDTDDLLDDCVYECAECPR